MERLFFIHHAAMVTDRLLRLPSVRKRGLSYLTVTEAKRCFILFYGTLWSLGYGAASFVLSVFTDNHNNVINVWLYINSLISALFALLVLMSGLCHCGRQRRLELLYLVLTSASYLA